MKCIVCEQPNQFKMVEVPLPSVQEGEALVRIRRVGVCGTDLHAYKGNQPFFSYPRILGHELAGIIDLIGQNDFGLQKGDQVSIIPYLECGKCVACRKGKMNCCVNLKVLGVHIDGGMQEYISIHPSHLVKTNGLSLDQSAMLEPLSIGAHAVRRAGSIKGEVILVIGAGPIGLGVMAFAKQRGAIVVAMDVNEERLKFCHRWAKVDYTLNALDDPIKNLSDITNGDLPTVVFDATGNVESMCNSFKYVAHGGKLIYVGLVKADITFSDPYFHSKELTLMGSRNATREDFDYVMSAVKTGKLDIESYISHRSSFDEMIERFKEWIDPESKMIKAIVEL
ncbi:putative L-galactonate oxidoreductase [Geobacillus sp. PA-3]|uniref:zinc-binding alcohol dehydrogenase family protein n=1 Tax=Geobacillus sp. PA-3 TaxID=1699078 RepID=UPI0006E4F66F|nr:zinc-binding alcohol dehydrogenase family protein [Geobacillus sp. PA-3]KQB91627.1 putative L-galactonate oxidoreductase [Geobacillus sp. PA-3]